MVQLASHNLAAIMAEKVTKNEISNIRYMIPKERFGQEKVKSIFAKAV